MRRIRLPLSFALAVVPGLVMVACTAADMGENVGTSDDVSLGSVPQHPHVDLCGQVREGGVRCHAKARATPDGQIQTMSAPAGYGPSDLRSAYALPASGGAGKTIAIVDANDNPTAEQDLAVYRSTYGLPPCTTANGCFKKVNQQGVQGSYPPADSGWAGEIALDLDMASAICPQCKLLLVEANSATIDDLGASVSMAASLGASVISNSYGGPDGSSSASLSSQYFNHPGITITVSSGDNGYGAQFPATSQYVIAVGGTTLVKSSSARGWAEGAWSGGGSGCSAAIPKPAWQTDNGCGQRTEVDVSAVADPNTGVAVYNAGSWAVYGGTSASSPIVAATFALLGLAGNGPSYAYSHASSFYDVTSGSNGSCGGSYLCTAKAGYDGPTGVGTPNGAALEGAGPPPDAAAPDASPPPDASAPDASPPDTGAPDSGTHDSGGGSTCAHPICSTGRRLTSSCDSCASHICAVDPYCCRVLWDGICVGEVGSVCGETCQ